MELLQQQKTAEPAPAVFNGIPEKIELTAPTKKGPQES
jgi:hypothetical protein